VAFRHWGNSEEDNAFDGSGSEDDVSVEEDGNYYTLERQRKADHDGIEQLDGAAIAESCEIARRDAKLIRREKILSNFHEKLEGYS
jgi:hypothetical protein